MASKFALVIANTEYTDPGLAQLTAPGHDAKEFVRVLDAPDLCGFDDVIIMLNEVASKVNETIDYFFSMKKPDDLLIMYFSGHGVRDEYGSLYLAVQNTNRARLRSTAIKADFIREAMDQSRSKRQILILDCCNSGAFAQGTKAEIGGSIGTAKAFEGTGYGRVILTASDSTQFAWEGDKVIGADITNSLFTHFLVKGLEGEADTNWDGRITIDELYDYAYEQVVRHTPKQTPGKWSYKQQGEIYLRENLKLAEVKPAPLPTDLLELIRHPNSGVRKVGIQELVALLDGSHLGLARSAQEKLREIAENDDSLSLRKVAAEVLSARGLESVSSPPTENPFPSPPVIHTGKADEKPYVPLEESQQKKTFEVFAAPAAAVQKENAAEKPSVAPLQVPQEKPIEAPVVWVDAQATSTEVVPLSVGEDVNPLPQAVQWKVPFLKIDKRLLSGILGVTLGIVFLAGAAKMFFNNGSGARETSTPTATLSPAVGPVGIAASQTAASPTYTSSSTATLTGTATSTRTSTPTVTATATRTLAPYFTAKPTKKKGGGGSSNPTPAPP